MTPTQLRQALSELDGHRDLGVAFADVHPPSLGLEIKKAMLIPDEPDHLVKVTDGKSIYILDAERIAWIRIELKKQVS
ncbi:MAG: hypothetical protein KF912_00770 [Phycisphaeraceae bacterium]|nr:hypothetical protein [Phycisphaeraceae bacterium]MBX3365831.1 hypothetical protein [Phycisphaeraceae bacterium]QYK48317.1 MAG: hypothetical protein KF838_00350 [Phycisphaeraceae bacterium]